MLHLAILPRKDFFGDTGLAMTCDVGLTQTPQREMEEHFMCFVADKSNSLQGQT